MLEFFSDFSPKFVTLIVAKDMPEETLCIGKKPVVSVLSMNWG
jgi:hypothetical protein